MATIVKQDQCETVRNMICDVAPVPYSLRCSRLSWTREQNHPTVAYLPSFWRNGGSLAVALLGLDPMLLFSGIDPHMI
ncbi:Chaperonin [Musa troglodytarum]|uniref:Chaperonin n=1 Tax=Musa troglodytarum TaxID=320322 RepID=A0A9E7LBS1_9LILI|nr:Chaperonin [Musa troglodytarum]